jgi:hypothetical protein
MTEPIAWMHNDITGNIITHRPADIDRHPERWTALYTAPPKKEWVGLTKEEARKICVATVPYVVDMAAAIEAKLKEKNT